MKKLISSILAMLLIVSILPLGLVQMVKADALVSSNRGNYTIETTLSDGLVQKTSRRTFFVMAKDGDGNKVTPTATFNGEQLTPTWDDATQTSFTLEFVVEGENTVTISAGDASITYTITYSPAEDGEYVGQAVFAIEVFSLGEGYVVEPVLTDIYAGDCAAAVLMRLLEGNGFNASYTGSVESGFYLATIKDGSIPSIPVTPSNAPAELVEALSSWGITLEDRYSENELGEFDYCYSSGWMYCLNNVFPNVGFSDAYLSDGDVVRVQFTVAYGSDIGGGYAMGGSDNTSFYPVANKDRLTALIAVLNAHGIEIPETVLNVATTLYAEQDAVNAAVETLQQLEDEYQFNAPVREVMEMISAIGEVTLESADSIHRAREAYDKLSEAQQVLVTNYNVLTAAEEALEALIEALPVSATFSVSNVDGIQGQQIEIPVIVSGKFEAHALEMLINYDDEALIINDVIAGDMLEHTTLSHVDFTTTLGTIYVGAICAEGSMSGTGIGEEIFLTIKATVAPDFHGETTVAVNVNRLANRPIGGETTDIDVTCENGIVTVPAPEYTVTYNVNGEEYAVQTYHEGDAIVVPDYAVPEGYTFSGWTVPATMPAENIVVDATLVINTYTVTFVDSISGEIIEIVSVEYGSDAVAPEVPEHDGFIFSGWEGDFTSVTEDRTVNALYVLCGDVDGDGSLTTADALTILRMALGIVAKPAENTLDYAICDFDKDGVISSVDALLILRASMELE